MLWRPPQVSKALQPSAGVTGGQGGTSIVVTNLNSSGTGSLKAAIEATGPRYITFAPGLNGTITFDPLNSTATSNMTLDGSGHNISISGLPLVIEGGARNIIIHNITFANTKPGSNAIFIIRYPSGTTFDSYWPGGATFREVELAHLMARVEPVSDSRVSVEADKP